MKKNIFILLVSLLSCQLAVLAQTSQVKNVDVEIYSDTTIVVRDLFGKNCKLYGDSILHKSDKIKQRVSEDGKKTDTRHYTKYGGDLDTLFNKRMKEANKDKEEYKKYVSRNKDGIVINLLYEEIPDTMLVLNFYGVLYDNKLIKKPNKTYVSSEWYRDINNIYCISITKQDTTTVKSAKVESINDEIKPSASGEASEPATIDIITDETKSLSITNENQKLIECLLIICLFIICLFIVVFVRINKLNKRINSFLNNQKQSSTKSGDIDIDKIKQVVISKIKPEELTQKISNEAIYSVLGSSDIQLYIQTIIAGKIEEYLRDNKVNCFIPSNDDGFNQHSLVIQPELRTTTVEYRADNNCFVISENSQNKIFEIYSINGEFYYTIVNDSSVRKEMLGFITAFSGCVETRQVSPIPSTVEVIRDGRLIKDGDMYIVDNECILQVSLM